MTNELKIKVLSAAYKKLFSEDVVESQEDFGLKLGKYNKGYISDLLNGRKAISDKVLQKLETVFGLSIEELSKDKPSSNKIDKTSSPDASFTTWKEGTGSDMLYRIIKDMGDLERRVAELEKAGKKN